MIHKQKIALILTIGLATEPSIHRIKTLKPDLVYFIHSKKSKENALFIIEETGIENYLFKQLIDHESVDDTKDILQPYIDKAGTDNLSGSIDDFIHIIR